MTTLAQIGLAASAAAASSTVAWFTLAGALGGVVIAGVIGLATAILNHRWQAEGNEQQRLLQHGAQVRQERRETYAAYWLAWNRFTHELRRVTDQVRQLPTGFTPHKDLDEELKAMANPNGLALLRRGRLQPTRRPPSRKLRRIEPPTGPWPAATSIRRPIRIPSLIPDPRRR